jgi:CHAD domain-containing protein
MTTDGPDVMTDDLAAAEIVGPDASVTIDVYGAAGVAPYDGGAATVPVSEPQAVEPGPVPVSELQAVGPGPETLATGGADMAQQAVEHLPIARTPEVVADDPWAEAGRKVIRFHLARMLAHVSTAIAGEDPEAVHDMRVAARRVRAAWRVFGDAYERPFVRERTRELRTLGGHLGAVRDLDVMLTILMAHRDRASKRQRGALTPLVDAWTTERAARHRDLVAHLASPWFGAVVASHEAFATTEGADVIPPPPHHPMSVRTRAPSVTWEAYGTVRAFEAVAGEADVDTLHELRIAAKWLRYTLEFVREPLEPAATELIRRVVVLQDHLGDIHDVHAAAALARGMAGSTDDLRSASRTAIERFASAQDARVERLRRRSGPAWRGVADPEFRRSLGRALARL